MLAGPYHPGKYLVLHLFLGSQFAYLLGWMRLLDRSAAAALDTFRPVLDLPRRSREGPAEKASTLEELRYRLTTLPPRPTLWASLAGVLLGAGHSPARLPHSRHDGPFPDGRLRLGPHVDLAGRHGRLPDPDGVLRGCRRRLHLSLDPSAPGDQPHLPHLRPAEPVPAAAAVRLLRAGRPHLGRIDPVQLRLVRGGPRVPRPAYQHRSWASSSRRRRP